MDQIERQVRLPEGARSIEDYARYYAQSSNSKIIAKYLVPISYDLGPDEGCEELLENFSSREVRCEPLPAFPGIAAGERKWLEDEGELPSMSDGGCMQVTVIYDRAKSAVTSALCNGTV